MRETDQKDGLKIDISEKDKLFISEVFFDKMVPKLKLLHARIGTLNCEFAGRQYGNWIIHFMSSGDDFKIIEFEYDADTAVLDLDRALPGKKR